MLLKIPKLKEYGFKQLKEALTSCLVFRDSAKWGQLRFLLTSDDEKDKNNLIANKLGDFQNSNHNVLSILEVYSGFPQEIDGLLKTIKEIEGDTVQYQQLNDIIYEIAENQQNELRVEIDKNKSSQNNINEMIGINNKDICSDFEDNWSSLCEILEDINWQTIWKASQKTLSIQRRTDWRDENKLKSLCFTKNYGLLKIFFAEQNKPQILITLGINLNKISDSDNSKLNTWLESIEKPNKGNSNHDIIREESQSIPILIIIAEKNTVHENWLVQGQFKFQGIQEKIEVEGNEIIGSQCDEFDEIPQIIEGYIAYLNNNPKFEKISTENLPIEQLRIEVFLPMSNLNLNFDYWAGSSETVYNSLVQENKIFLRSRDRYKGIRGGTNKRMLARGWNKLELCLKNNCQEINIIDLIEYINKDKVDSEIVKILENSQVDNWTEVTHFMINSQKLWGVKLEDTLPKDINERGKFFASIFSSGIPVTCWHWESIANENVLTSFETKFAEYFCKKNLSNRCHTLLDNIWKLRSVAWGYSDVIKRQQSPGYYFGMLLEDPEIMPDDKALKSAQRRE